MNALTRNFTDPAWWMTVVVFGILINLTAAYLKSTLDRLGTLLYPKFASAIGRGLAALDAEVHALRGSFECRTATQLLKIEYLVKAIGTFLLSVQLYGAATRAQESDAPYVSATLHIAGVLCGLYASGCIGRYRRFADALKLAWRLGPLGTD